MVGSTFETRDEIYHIVFQAGYAASNPHLECFFMEIEMYLFTFVQYPEIFAGYIRARVVFLSLGMTYSSIPMSRSI